MRRSLRQLILIQCAILRRSILHLICLVGIIGHRMATWLCYETIGDKNVVSSRAKWNMRDFAAAAAAAAHLIANWSTQREVRVLNIINVLTRPISDWTRETARVRGSICHNTQTNFITLPQMIPTNSVCKWADWNRATAMGWSLLPRHQNKVYNCAANDSTKLCKCVGYIRLKRRPDRGRGCQWIGLSESAPKTKFYNSAANDSDKLCL